MFFGEDLTVILTGNVLLFVRFRQVDDNGTGENGATMLMDKEKTENHTCFVLHHVIILTLRFS